MWKAFDIANKGWKAHCHFLQNLSKRSSVSRTHLSLHAYTACVEWCGIGYQDLIKICWKWFNEVLFSLLSIVTACSRRLTACRIHHGPAAIVVKATGVWTAHWVRTASNRVWTSSRTGVSTWRNYRCVDATTGVVMLGHRELRCQHDTLTGVLWKHKDLACGHDTLTGVLWRHRELVCGHTYRCVVKTQRPGMWTWHTYRCVVKTQRTGMWTHLQVCCEDTENWYVDTLTGVLWRHKELNWHVDMTHLQVCCEDTETWHVDMTHLQVCCERTGMWTWHTYRCVVKTQRPGMWTWHTYRCVVTTQRTGMWTWHTYRCVVKT